MVTVNYININEIDPFVFDKGFHTIPPAMKASLLKYRVEEDRIRGVMGKLLLQKLLVENGYSENVLHQITLNQYNRPYLNETVDFNIAHSAAYVICAISKETKVGVDIEKMEAMDVEDFDMHFSKKESIALKQSKDPMNDFYSIWSQKEAVAKADGRGLGIDLPTIELYNQGAVLDGESWLLKEMEIDLNYKSYVAYKGNREIQVSKVGNEDLRLISY